MQSHAACGPTRRAQCNRPAQSAAEGAAESSDTSPTGGFQVLREEEKGDVLSGQRRGAAAVRVGPGGALIETGFGRDLGGSSWDEKLSFAT